MNLRFCLSIAAIVLLAAGAASADEVSPLWAHNAQIVGQEPKTAGVFAVRPDGKIYHFQSGLMCPAEFQNVQFAGLKVLPSPGGPGTAVECDYERKGADGKPVSTLVIFATKAEAGTTLDTAFAAESQTIQKAHPGATAMPPSLHIGTPETGQAKNDYRSSGFAYSSNGGRAHTELIVGLWYGWVLGVRASYPRGVAEPTKDKVFDFESPYLAFTAARNSVQVHNQPNED